MELLFSYGTLQQPEVQIATFGRQVTGQPDQLVGFSAEPITITDPAVVATSGKSVHVIVRRTGDSHDRVPGTVFEITPEELARADAYEVAEYKRVLVTLGSGQHAWVYVDARET